MKDDGRFEQWAEERRQRLAEREARRAQRRAEQEAGTGQGGEPEGDEGAAAAGDADDPGSGRPRKERVLHTRISEALDAALRRASDELRVPVSNLVRNVLEDVFTVVETVTESVEDLVGDVVDSAGMRRERTFGTHARWHRHRSRTTRSETEFRASSEPDPEPAAEPEPPPAPPRFADVIGWQDLLLNAPQTCAACATPLPRGGRAFLGLRAAGPPQTYLCRPCMRAQR